jgi:hypothetical protein
VAPKGSVFPLRAARVPPSTAVALLAVLLIMLSTAAALGLTSGFLALAGIKFNAISLQVSRVEKHVGQQSSLGLITRFTP